MSLKGRKGIVTGAAQGIGRAIADALADAGADVAIFDVQKEAAAGAARELAAKGIHAIPVEVDVTRTSEVEAAVESVAAQFGGLDFLVNNAGIARDNLIIRMKEEDWDAVIAVNLKSVFNCTRSACRRMLKARRGSIVNVASIVGIMGNAGQASYSASKGGVIALTKTLAKEFAGRGVRVNAVAPGFIDTAMTRALPQDTAKAMLSQIPLGRFGAPSDVADAVKFLLDDTSAFITGQVIQIDGGMLM